MEMEDGDGRCWSNARGAPDVDVDVVDVDVDVD
jgi:hypothetical protein